MTGADDLVEVRILALPVRILREAREHGDGLIREFTLIQLTAAAAAGVPERLVALGEELRQRFSGFTADTDAELERAEGAGAAEVDLVYRLPADASDACRRLGELLDEA